MVVVGNCSPQSMQVMLGVFTGRGMLENSELDTIFGYCKRRLPEELGAWSDAAPLPSGVAVVRAEDSGLGESVIRVGWYCA